MKEDNKQFYSAFKSKSEVIFDSWKDFVDQEWVSYYGFEAILVPSIIWRQEKILRTIDEKFPFKSVGLIKIPINYNYNWHVDDERGCGINMLLEHEESHSLFRESKYKDNYNNNAFFTELKYKPNTFYAFNTQKSHCVYNFNKPRYLFTCEFAQNHNELSYAMLNEWKKQNNL